MSKLKKTPPNFETEAEERGFWESHDSSDYVDWKQARSASLPNLKPSTKTISLRLPEVLLERIKIEANKREICPTNLLLRRGSPMMSINTELDKLGKFPKSATFSCNRREYSTCMARFSAQVN